MGADMNRSGTARAGGAILAVVLVAAVVYATDDTTSTAAGRSTIPADNADHDDEAWVDGTPRAGGFAAQLDSERVSWRDRPQSTDRTDWTPVSLSKFHSGQLIYSTNPIMLTMSMTVTGGPIELRVTDKG